MAEIQNAAPEEEYNDDGSKNPDYVAPKIEGESDADTKKEAEIEEEKEEIEFNDTIDPETPPEIPIRQSVAQHIIARKNEKIKKLESKLNEEDEYVPPTEDENIDDTLTDEANRAIETKVQKAIAPLLGKMASEADEKELQTLITQNPEAKKYVNHIKAYMGHEAYKGVSPVVIYHHLAWTAAQALGAKKKATADLEANQSKSGGRNLIPAPKIGDLPFSAEDVENMSDADLEKYENDARQGKFIK